MARGPEGLPVTGKDHFVRTYLYIISFVFKNFLHPCNRLLTVKLFVSSLCSVHSHKNFFNPKFYELKNSTRRIKIHIIFRGNKQ